MPSIKHITLIARRRGPTIFYATGATIVTLRQVPHRPFWQRIKRWLYEL